MKQWCLAALAFSLLGCATPAIQDGQRSHAYAFDQPSLLATQRVFGVGNAVTLLGEACAHHPAALASYEQWQSMNFETLRSMTTQLALHYRIQALPDEQQKRVAEAMHLRTRLALADDALEGLHQPTRNAGAALDESCAALSGDARRSARSRLSET